MRYIILFNDKRGPLADAGGLKYELDTKEEMEQKIRFLQSVYQDYGEVEVSKPTMSPTAYFVSVEIQPTFESWPP